MSLLNSHSRTSVLNKAARGCTLQYEQTVHVLLSPALKSYSFCWEKKQNIFFSLSEKHVPTALISIFPWTRNWLERCGDAKVNFAERKTRGEALCPSDRPSPDLHEKKSNYVAHCRRGVPPPPTNQPATLHLRPPRPAVCRRALRRPPVFQQSFKMDR